MIQSQQLTANHWRISSMNDLNFLKGLTLRQIF